MAGVEEKVREIVLPFIEAAGLELWGIRYRGGRDHAALQIYVEGPQGVSIDQCGDLSNLISPALDVADPIAPKYTLEISSPGMDRILFNAEQAARYTGSDLKMELRIPAEGKRKFTARLNEVSDGILKLAFEDGTLIEVAFSNILLARVIPVFPDQEKKKPGVGKKKTEKTTLDPDSNAKQSTK